MNSSMKYGNAQSCHSLILYNITDARIAHSNITSNIGTSWTQRIQILLDVADGLAYLHLFHKSVHQDLKSPNILLEKIIRNDDASRSDKTVTHRAKIADFGLSKIFIKGKKRIGT